MNAEIDYISWIYYAIPVLIIIIYSWSKSRLHKENRDILAAAHESGMAEPASLHPIIDETKCLGCKSCITACPESKKKVIGIINNKAHLINPANCIGHGACKRACPLDAISLVFGTATRGVDIPFVSETFETNVSGIYIAGELGGMGLIRNAIEQGKQAMHAIQSAYKTSSQKGLYDVAIIGAGPAGFSATLAAHDKKFKYITLEQDSLGGTVFNFPRGKLVMTAPVNLPIIGKVKITETSKEILLKLWQNIEQKTGIKIHYREKLETIHKDGDRFIIKTDKNEYRSQSVLLCIGRRGTPRKLGVPGEELPKVVYNLIDPEQYINQKVLIVGGGDSALEAALSISEQPGSQVSISYRSGSFSRAKEKNRMLIQQASEQNTITVIYNSTVKSIDKNNVTLNLEDKQEIIDNDAIIVNAGGILPTGFLKETGIEVETKHGTA